MINGRILKSKMKSSLEIIFAAMPLGRMTGDLDDDVQAVCHFIRQHQQPAAAPALQPRDGPRVHQAPPTPGCRVLRSGRRLPAPVAPVGRRRQDIAGERDRMMDGMGPEEPPRAQPAVLPAALPPQQIPTASYRHPAPNLAAMIFAEQMKLDKAKLEGGAVVALHPEVLVEKFSTQKYKFLNKTGQTAVLTPSFGRTGVHGKMLRQYSLADECFNLVFTKEEIWKALSQNQVSATLGFSIGTTVIPVKMFIVHPRDLILCQAEPMTGCSKRFRLKCVKTLYPIEVEMRVRGGIIAGLDRHSRDILAPQMAVRENYSLPLTIGMNVYIEIFTEDVDDVSLELWGKNQNVHFSCDVTLAAVLPRQIMIYRNTK